MPMIRECIVTTLSAEGKVHIAPLGLIAEEEGGWIIAPFRPSATLDNLRATPYAVANFTDDVLVFAGCLTGRKDWPTRPATHVPGAVLDGALAHAELEGRACARRTSSGRASTAAWCTRRAMRRSRASTARKAAVIEAAILASRLHMLPREKIERELGYLQIAVEKTAGPREHEAWRLLVEKIEEHYKHAQPPSG